MALFSECTERYAQNMLDTADIVRDAISQQLAFALEPRHAKKFPYCALKSQIPLSPPAWSLNLLVGKGANNPIEICSSDFG